MKPKTMILLALAVICGLAASYMTSRLLAERERGDKPAEGEKVKVLVAKQNLMPMYIKDPEQFFVEKDFIKGQEPKKAAKSFDEIRAKFLNKPLSAEQWVSVDDLLKKDQLGLQVPEGMRAVTIRVNIDTIVAGFVLPNSRVDVVNTVRADSARDSYSQIILENMLVLAVDTLDVKDPDKRTNLSNTATLAVTPEEGMKLALAGTMGELRLMLRTPGDDKRIASRTVRPEDVRRGTIRGGNPGVAEEDPTGSRSLSLVPDVPPVSRPGADPEKPEVIVKKPKKHVLRIWNGESLTNAVFVDGDPDDEPETQIQKSQPEREGTHRPEKAPIGPTKDRTAPAPATDKTSPAPTRPAAPQPGPG